MIEKQGSYEFGVSEIANPSTQGSGRNVFRLIPMTLMIVFIAATPSDPERRATLAGYMQKHCGSY
jgi:hypothetical protein